LIGHNAIINAVSVNSDGVMVSGGLIFFCSGRRSTSRSGLFFFLHFPILLGGFIAISTLEVVLGVVFVVVTVMAVIVVLVVAVLIKKILLLVVIAVLVIVIYQFRKS
jgi:hypothetical protein